MGRRLALIAGSGALASMLLNAARNQGDEVLVLAIGGAAIEGATPVDILRPEDVLRRVVEFKSTHLLFAGGVRISNDARRAWMGFAGLPHQGPIGDTALSHGLAAIAASHSLGLVGAHQILPALLAQRGLIAGPEPDAATIELAVFALAEARRAGRLDLGQAIVSSGRQIVASEDIEGTDALLRRVELLPVSRSVGTPLILAKARKPDQPDFVDLPAIGPRTVANAARAGIRVIVIEAGHTLMLDREAIAEVARGASITVIGLSADG